MSSDGWYEIWELCWWQPSGNIPVTSPPCATSQQHLVFIDKSIISRLHKWKHPLLGFLIWSSHSTVPVKTSIDPNINIWSVIIFLYINISFYHQDHSYTSCTLKYYCNSCMIFSPIQIYLQKTMWILTLLVLSFQILQGVKIFINISGFGNVLSTADRLNATVNKSLWFGLLV